MGDKTGLLLEPILHWVMKNKELVCHSVGNRESWKFSEQGINMTENLILELCGGSSCTEIR